MLDSEYMMLMRFAVKFLLRDGVLYQGAKRGMPPRSALGNTMDEKEVLSKLQDELGHQETDETYEKPQMH